MYFYEKNVIIRNMIKLENFMLFHDQRCFTDKCIRTQKITRFPLVTTGFTHKLRVKQIQ